MSEKQTFNENGYRVEVTADKMTANLFIGEERQLSAEVLAARLTELGIAGFDRKRLDEAVAKPAWTGVVATGTAPVDQRSEQLTFDVDFGTCENGRSAQVTSGQKLATVGPAVAGSDGRDVFCKAIPYNKLAAFRPGPGVTRNAASLLATAAGNFRSTEEGAGIFPLLEMREEQMTATPVSFAGDVAFAGCLRMGRSLRLSGALVVKGAIEATGFDVGYYAHVTGGVIGRETGAGAVGGDLWCRFILGAQLAVGGDVFVQSELANSQLQTSGRLTVGGGPIFGGQVVANGGIVCRELGNEACTATIVEVGSDQVLRSRLERARLETVATRKRIAIVRERVGPLMQRLKTLTAQQKEKATELLYEADELESGLEEKLNALAEPCRRSISRSKPEVVVQDCVYPGVTLRFPGAQTVVERVLKGPLTIASRTTAGATEIFVQFASGLSMPLTSSPVANFTPTVDRCESAKAA